MSTLQLDGEYGSFVERFLDPRSVSGHYVMCLCVFHDDHTASMQFNLDRGLFTCFACGVGGSYRKIERALGVHYVAGEVGLEVVYRKLQELKDIHDHSPRTLDESVLAPYYDMGDEHWKARGLLPHTIASFDLGYDIVANAMTIPIRNIRGDLVGITRRFLDDDADPRYKYPRKFKRAENLFASWMVAEDPDAHHVALTEGAIDAMSIWQAGLPAMAVYGSSVSESHIRILRMLGVSRVTLFFDNDNAGQHLVKQCQGWKRTGQDVWEKHPEMDLRRFCDVYCVPWRNVPRHEAKDANDLSDATIQKMLDGAFKLG